MFISDGKEWDENTRKQPDLVGLSENRQKKWKTAIFSKSPNVPILKFYGAIPTTYVDIPKNKKARHGIFFFIRITFSSHVCSLPCALHILRRENEFLSSTRLMFDMLI